MMNILALETSTHCCSVALSTNNVIFEKQAFIPQKHEQVLLSWINELFTEAQLNRNSLDVICYSAGPGGFTGIRIGAAIAQGLALAQDLTVLAIPSLQVIAQGVHREKNVSNVVIIQDARIEQVYLGYYQVDSAGIMRAVNADSICKLTEINLSEFSQHSIIVSNMADLKGIEFNPAAIDVLFLGKDLLQKGVATKAIDALPIYLRTENAWKKL